MISLEQIRLLESKITRAIELIRILKEENGTLRRGLESAQKRMKELETLVDGFKTDQREIESVIIRTLHNLDELEESAATGKKTDHAGGSAPAAPAIPAARPAAASPADPKNPTLPEGQEPRPPKEELDIF
jgi:FtsZ-binding cell division protein ZapB